MTIESVKLEIQASIDTKTKLIADSALMDEDDDVLAATASSCVEVNQ